MAVRIGALFVLAQSAQSYLADSPCLGINSWDWAMTWSDEPSMLANAQIVADVLRPVGYQFVVTDEGWMRHNNNTADGSGFAVDYEGYNVDPYGRFLPSPDRFTNGSFSTLCSAIRALGLQCGAHLVYGVPVKAVNARMPILGTQHTADEIVYAGSEGHVQGGNDPCAYAINWTHPAAYPWIASQVDILVSQGISFIKLDFLWPEIPVITMYRQAMNESGARYGRPVTLSINSGYVPFDTLRALGVNMLRMTGDTWDEWGMIVQHVQVMGQYFTGMTGGLPGFWPDADMLPIGRIGGKANWTSVYPSGGQCSESDLGCGNASLAAPYPQCCPRQSRLTPTETLTMLGLWSIARSPLMVGADLTQSPPWLLQALANEEVVQVNQQAVAGSNMQMSPVPAVPNSTVVWYSTPSGAALGQVRHRMGGRDAQGAGEARWLYVVNTGEQAVSGFTVNLTSVFDTASHARSGASPSFALRDLWARAPAGSTGSQWVLPTLPAHASLLYAVLQQE